MALKGVIFDMDGVIIDSERLHDIASHDFFAARWIIYDRDTVKPMLMGKSPYEVAEIIKKYYTLPDSIDTIVEEKRTRLQKIFDEQLDFVPWFLEYYDYITQQGLKSIIATWSTQRIIDKIDKKLWIKKIFWDNIVTVDQVGWVGKPDPSLFQAAVKKLGIDVSECLIIEDAINWIQAAKNAGIKVVGFVTTLSADLLATAEPDYIIFTFPDIQYITDKLLHW